MRGWRAAPDTSFASSVQPISDAPQEGGKAGCVPRVGGGVERPAGLISNALAGWGSQADGIAPAASTVPQGPTAQIGVGRCDRPPRATSQVAIAATLPTHNPASSDASNGSP